MKNVLACAALLAAAAAATGSAAVLNTSVRSSTGPFSASADSGQPVRQDYERAARRQLDDLKGQLDAAERRAAQLNASARAEADRRVAELKTRVAQAQKQVDDLERSGEQRWHLMRKHLDSTLESLRREYESLRKDLDQQKRKR